MKIELKDFDGYSGGLDTKTGNTGEYSIYSVYKGMEIMFHVSTLLPYRPTEPVQVYFYIYLIRSYVGSVILEMILF